MSSKNDGQIVWINSLKFFASIFVLWSHYYEGFLYIDAASGMNQAVLDVLNATRGIVKGDLWVCVFCFISGMFVGKKKIVNLKILFTESILRYLRFVIPFFTVGVMIWILSLCGGFLNPESNSIIGDNWYFNIFYAEKIDLRTFLLGVFTFDSALNQPAWMMKMMLFGNLLILTALYFEAKTGRKEVKTVFLALCLIASFIFNKLYIGSCLVGALLAPIMRLNESKRARIVMISTSVLVTAVVFSDMAAGLLYTSVIKFGHDYQTIRDFFIAPSIVVLINSTDFIKRILSVNFWAKLSPYSFPIFLIHWPVMSSLSLYLFKQLLPICSYTTTFIVVFLITTLTVVFLAVLYGETINKYTDRLLKLIKRKMYSVIAD